MKDLGRDPRQIGNIIRSSRRQNNISQQQLAKMTGLRQSTISLIENGYSRARIDTLLAVLAALNLEFHIAPRSHEWDKNIETFL
jgi:HTH-type transcriptional regulator/antitoxin HipB